VPPGDGPGTPPEGNVMLLKALRFACIATLAMMLVASPATASDPDPYPPSVAVTSCSGFARPGVVEFRDMVLSRIGGGAGNIYSCRYIAGTTTYSDHADGRAWDWMVSANDADDLAKANLVTDWLFNADENGKPHAMARRLGIRYIIWNRRIVEFSSESANWGPYGGTNPHTDHVHFSFAPTGANQQTSWFTTNPKPAHWYPDSVAWRAPITTVAQDNGLVDVFWRDTGSGISHKFFSNGVWYGPESMNVGTVGSEPVVTTTTGGMLFLFWRGTDNHLWLKHFNGSSWQPHVSLGSGPLGSAPVAVGQPNGIVDVFWKGTDGGLWHKWLAYGAWYGPENMNVGTMGSDPQVATTSAGGLEVVWRGTDNALWHKRFNGSSWEPYATLGGSIVGTPKVVGQSSGIVDVFWQGTNGGLWTVRNNGAWSAPVDLNAGQLGSKPTAVATANGGLEVLWKGTDNHLWHKTFTGTAWLGFSTLGSGPLGSSPFAAGQPNGIVDVFWKGTDGGLWHKWLAYGTWYGPENLGGAIA